MAASKLSRRDKQSGISLIGLMVGLFISMMCILASLTLYKNLIHVAAESKVDTVFDGQMTTALMVAQMQIQTAGFGIDDAGTDDIVVQTTPQAGSVDAKSELLWRYQEGATVKCVGLVDETVSVTENSESYIFRRLMMQQVDSGCNTTTNLVDMTWTPSSVLARWNRIGTLKTYINGGNNLFNYSLATVQCSPFGAVAQDQHLQITITTPSSTTLNTSAGTAENSLLLCLPNTYPG